MKHFFDGLSPQAALLRGTMNDMDEILKKDFILTPLSELEPLGIDRIFFLGFIQITALYMIHPEGEQFTVDLNHDSQLAWPYQALAQWMVLASVPKDTIYIFNMLDFKTRITNWKIKAENRNSVAVSFSELDLFTLKKYPFVLPPETKKKFKSLNWTY